MGFAQVDTPPNAVPEQTDGKDYAGRPVAAIKVPPAPPLPASEQQFQQIAERWRPYRTRAVMYLFEPEYERAGRRGGRPAVGRSSRRRDAPDRVAPGE